MGCTSIQLPAAPSPTLRHIKDACISFQMCAAAAACFTDRDNQGATVAIQVLYQIECAPTSDRQQSRAYVVPIPWQISKRAAFYWLQFIRRRDDHPLYMVLFVHSYARIDVDFMLTSGVESHHSYDGFKAQDRGSFKSDM